MDAAERYGAGGENNVRRYARSMVEAFGPHTDGILYPMPDPPRQGLRIEEKAAKLARQAKAVALRAVILVAGH